jgi:amino acid adenylation domain-containing protein
MKDSLVKFAALSPEKKKLLALRNPLSFAQQRLWFLDQFNPQSAFYSGVMGLNLKGSLDVSALEEALGEIRRRHEILRTVFLTVEGLPMQLVLPAGPMALPVTDLSNCSSASREQELHRLAAEETLRPFDLSAGPLWRLRLVKLAEDDHVLLLAIHHIISDAWSIGVFMRELTLIYEAFRKGEASPLEDLPFQYADYARWQRRWLQGETLNSQLAYWKRQLDGAPEALDLPTDYARPIKQSFQGKREYLTFSKDLSASIRKLCGEAGATLYIVLLAAFKTLLFRYSGQERITVGSPVANRRWRSSEEMIGLFVNTLALHTNLEGAPGFLEAVRRVQDVTIGAYDHQDMPFEKLVEILQSNRDLSRNPLFQVMFALQNTPMPERRPSGLSLSPLEVDIGSAKFDMTFTLGEKDGRLMGAVEYCTDLFDEETIKRMLRHYQTLVAAAVADPGQPITWLPILGESERLELVESFNETWAPGQSAWRSELCVHVLFSEQAAHTPEAVAVSDERQSLSYQELDRRSNQLSAYLRELGAGPESIVGLMVERGVEMVVALLGILKADAAYLPLDARLPKERLRYMLEDGGARVLVCTEPLLTLYGESGLTEVLLDRDREIIERRSDENRHNGAHAANLMYVLYTSGSTGQPKGVGIEHRSAINFLLSMSREPGLSRQDRLLALTTISFDISILELLLPLIVGAHVEIASRELASDGRLLARRLSRGDLTVSQATPSTWRMAVDAGWATGAGIKVLCGGEAMPSDLADKLLERSDDVWNLYGPTETTIWSSCKQVLSAATITIGRPIADTQLYILDRRAEVVPAGVAGEIHIGGGGVARGYVGRADVTAEKFLPDPYSRQAGARMYRTGDCGRYRAGGEIECLGRTDAQVKLRGHRIEPGEIEAALREHPAVDQAVILLRQDERGEKGLVGYVTRHPESALSIGELRSFLRHKLPEYMIPQFFVSLEKLPLTPNGKLDRRSLPMPERLRPETVDEYRSPATPMQELVAEIWATVLGVDRVGLGESFFDLGGHSLLATQVIARVNEATGEELPLNALFESPTVEGMASRVEAQRESGERGQAPPLKRASRERGAALSFAQQRMWFLDKLEPGRSVYNLPAAIRLSGALNVDALERSLMEIVRRHEILRTRFVEEEGAPKLEFTDGKDIRLERIDLRGRSEFEREKAARELASESAWEAFDLNLGPLLKLKLLRLGDEEHALVIVTHHAVSDGWSVGVLVKELSALYDAYSRGEESPLAELDAQYADYAAWQREWLKEKALEEEVEYWREALHGANGLLELETAKVRTVDASQKGAYEEFALERELSDKLRRLSWKEGATLFMTLLSGFAVLLKRYSGQEDILIGTPIAGRTRREFEGLIGLFVNTLVIRGDLRGNPSFRELIRRVRGAALGAYHHQHLPFDKLVEILRPDRYPNRNPLFQVWFVLHNTPKKALDLQGLTLSEMDFDCDSVRHDLRLAFTETPKGLIGSFQYKTDMFDRASILRMINALKELFKIITEDTDLAVCSVVETLLSKEEQDLEFSGAQLQVARAQKIKTAKRKAIRF